MQKIKVIGQTVPTGELGQTNKHTNGRTDATNYIISLASRSIKDNGPMYMGAGHLEKIKFRQNHPTMASFSPANAL